MANPLFDDKTLHEITLPGTHDSATYELSNNYIDLPSYLQSILSIAKLLHISASKIINSWAQAQDQNIYQQLNNGIRYLDMRIVWYQNVWHSCHSWVVGNPLEDSLSSIKKFLDENPQEIIIVEFQHVHDGSQQNKIDLINHMKNMFTGYFFPRTQILSEYTLKQMRDQNQRLIMTFQDNQVIENHNEFWYSNSIINTYADSPDITQMQQYNAKQIRNFKSASQYNNQLFKISYDLTPNATTIENMFVSGNPQSLIELADKANATLLKWFQQMEDLGFTYPILGHIFIIDHFESSDIINIVKMQTKQQQNTQAK